MIPGGRTKIPSDTWSSQKKTNKIKGIKTKDMFKGKDELGRSGILAWKIPWAEKPGGLQSVHGVAKESNRT